MINTPRVFVAGLVAGLVMNIVDFLVNGVLLAAQWQAAMRALNPALNAMSPTAITGYIVLDFVFGILIVWTYAAMRPRFGPGPETALIASITVWLISLLSGSNLVLTGMTPIALFTISAIGSLVGWVAGGYVGGRLYVETPTRVGA